MVLVDVDAAIDHHADDFPDLLGEANDATAVVFPDEFPRPIADEDSDVASLDDEDVVLENLLTENPVLKQTVSPDSLYPTKFVDEDQNESVTSKTVSDGNSPTQSPTESPQPNHVGRQLTLNDLAEENYNPWDLRDLAQPPLSDEVEEDAESVNSEGTTELLMRARGRLHEQHLTEEIESLKTQLMRKNDEIEVLNGQLRRAIATKADLIVAHTDLEYCHERDLQVKDDVAAQLKRDSLTQQEMRYEVEKEFMNEIFKLTEQMEATRASHECEMLEKDYQISQLRKQLRDLTASGMFCLE